MSKVTLVTSQLIDHLIPQINKADSIYILTSFVMKSGVKLLKPHLIEAVERGAEVKLCAGDYLFITQPDALQFILDIPKIEVRIWQSNGRSFHPKAYIFGHQSKEQKGMFFIGSSNLSKSALSSGVEWNIGIQEGFSPATYEEVTEEFLRAFYHENTYPLNYETVKSYQGEYERYHHNNPNLVMHWSELEEIDLMLSQTNETNILYEPTEEYIAQKQPEIIKPRPAQQEALEALESTYIENYDKAMVVMATGLGKTYLAGFFAQRFKRVLFVAHREEILYQSRKSFKRVQPNKSAGIYNAKNKDVTEDFIFASVFTLSTDKNLKAFSQTDFDLIVIDEFHHAAAKSYQKVLDYFNPKFLLGITATPDRMDNKDVYGICDGNVAYQLHFIEAIQKQWLTPFRYYGVYDDTDYSQITWLGNKYDQEELLQVQLNEELAEKILSAWQKHKQTKTIGFCSSIKQADFLSVYFNKKGYKTISLHSKTVELKRDQAINLLKAGELDTIFTVDLFNEGVDIPAVDTLLFVRPTESLTVFTQQVGRGLRLYEGKEYCNIIDLIGNYRNADIKLSLFDVNPQQKKSKVVSIQPTIPDFCEINLDVRVIDLLKELERKRQPRKEKLLYAYRELKHELGKRPTYLDLHLNGKENSREYRQEFKSFPRFLQWAEELSDEELRVLEHHEKWIQEVESTNMSKSYKMIVLMYMLSRGTKNWDKEVTPAEVAPYFHQYLTEKDYRKHIDFSDKSSKKLWEYDEEKVSKLIAKMPMTMWSGPKSLTSFEEGIFRVNFKIADEDRETLYQWTKEICEYRLHVHFERKG